MRKSTIIVVLVIVAAGIAYFYYEGFPSPDSSSLQASSDEASVGTQVLDLLNQIRSLKIDTSLFSDPAYLTLRDYTVQIPPENVGRTNPFAPLPGETTAASPAIGAPAP